MTDFTIYSEDGDEIHLPTHKVVCYRCRGNGKHVHPDVDGGGISSDEFREDPDFAESYFRGVYDVVCQECRGANVLDEVDEDALAPELLTAWRDWQREESDYRAMVAAERRMGC